jgi:nitrogen fixation protein NifU and related proteins
MYNRKIIDHFQNPHNMGEMREPTVKKRIGNKICGDVMELALKIEGQVIKDAKFQTFGCAAAIATSSILTDMIKGKKISTVKNLKPADIDQSLDGLPVTKKHCAVMALEALNSCLKELP